MKKRKKTTSTSQSEKRTVSGIIPLISKKEDNPLFVAQACNNADELFLLLVVDTAAMPGQFGFAASEIGQGNGLMQNVKQQVEQRKVNCEDIMEWGDTESKIIHLVQLQKIGKVFLVKQDNQFFKNLVKALEEKTDAEITIIRLPAEDA